MRTKSFAMLAAILAMTSAAALSGCADTRAQLPAWVPFSGAADVELSGAQVVPPVETYARGSGTFRLQDNGMLSGKLSTQNLQATAARIHLGAPGVEGPAIVELKKGPGNTFEVPEGRTLSTTQAKAFEEGNLYVMVASQDREKGEIRGQIRP